MTQAVLNRKYGYRRRLPHFQKADRAMFVTFCSGGYIPFSESVRDIILWHCLHDHEVKARMHAVVVIPDRVHLLLTPLLNADGYPYSLVEILQAIKSSSAHRINRILQRSGPMWQDESFDHVLRSDGSFELKLEYIRQNPVRRGLVPKPEDYPWLWLDK